MRNPLQSFFEAQLAGLSQKLTQAVGELERMELEGSAGGGAVRIRMSGTAQVLEVIISPEALSENDPALLEGLVAAALRDVLAKVARARKEKLLGATPLAGLGLDIPDII